MYDLPDARGHFGPYGGVFVAETLTHALDELRDAYERARADLYCHILRGKGRVRGHWRIHRISAAVAGPTTTALRPAGSCASCADSARRPAMISAFS